MFLLSCIKKTISDIVLKFVCVNKMFISQSIWMIPVDTSVELLKAEI